MAHKIDTFDDHAIYKDMVQNINEAMTKLDLDHPEHNVVRENATTMELLQLQSQIQSQTLGKTLEFIKVLLPLQDSEDSIGLLAPNAGDKVTVQAQRDYLEKIAKEQHLISKMLQMRQNEKDIKSQGSYFDPSRDPISTIPNEIATGNTEQASDSAIKLLNNFKGDTEDEAENLKSFLRSIYDVSTTNKLTEKCTIAILKRKLQGTARRLIDTYLEEFSDPNKVSLKEIVLKLEDRFMADLQPEIASAKLSMYTKLPHQTYQMMEGEISELA